MQTPSAKLRFWGPSPIKMETSKSCCKPLANYHCSFGEKRVVRLATKMRAKMAKTMPLKRAKKGGEIERNSSKRHQFWPTGLIFWRYGASWSF